MILVLAGNYREFRNWCNENRIHHTSKLVIFADNCMKIKALDCISEIIIYGTWFKNKEMHIVKKEAEYRRMRYCRKYAS
jgi:hypothetical protein